MDCWHNLIESSHTPSEVARTAADYLSLWSPNELAPITQGWREVRIDTPEDVRTIKTWLLDSPEELNELAGYFWHAAERIERIRAVSGR